MCAKFQQDLSQGQDSSPVSTLPITSKTLTYELKHFANVDAKADASGSAIALPELCSDQLKNVKSKL